LIDRLRNKEIDSEERINNKLINSQNTIGMINSILITHKPPRP